MSEARHCIVSNPTPEPPTPPLAGGPEWLAVVTRAGMRCECTRCPQHKKEHQGRCEREHMPSRALLAAPHDPSPDPARRIITGVPLLAYCPPCYDAAVASARKARRTELASAAADAPSLF